MALLVEAAKWRPLDRRNVEWQALAEMPKNPRFPPNRGAPVEILVLSGGAIARCRGPAAGLRHGERTRCGAWRRAALRAARGVGRRAARDRVGRPRARGRAAAAARSATLDTLLVAGGPGVHAAAPRSGGARLAAARAPSARGVSPRSAPARFCSAPRACLKERRAATHWMHCADLARRYPDIRVEPDPIFVRDGAVWTSAGVTAAIDLALALVEEDAGRDARRSQWRGISSCSSSGPAARRSSAPCCRCKARRIGLAHCTPGSAGA